MFTKINFRPVFLTALIGLLAGVLACSSITVRSDFDSTADFTRYRTYAWLPTPRSGDIRIDNTLVESRIKLAVDRELQSKGFQLALSGEADFLVGYHAAVNQRLSLTTVDNYYGYGWRAGGLSGMSSTTVDEWDEGTIIFDIVDRESEELVWRGSGQARIDEDRTPEERQKGINEAVTKVFENFPPTSS